MELPPAAAELLDIVAEVLEDLVLGSVPPGLQHQARVAASLVRIVERELTLGRPRDEAESSLLAQLLGRGGEQAELRAAAVERIRNSDDPAFLAAGWRAAVGICREDLAIVKPGHDSWESG